jgi:L-seryl-tRNA(Ser) seleniumtransferase
MLKVGREEIAALIAALEDFVQRDHAAEQDRSRAIADEIAGRLEAIRGAVVSRNGPDGWVAIDFSSTGGPSRAAAAVRNLRAGSPRIFCHDGWVHEGRMIVNPATVRDDEVDVLVERIIAECDRGRP